MGNRSEKNQCNWYASNKTDIDAIATQTLSLMNL